jgi:hypothetical protein
LFLLGQSLFPWMTAGSANFKRLAAAGAIVGLAPLGTRVSALVLATVVTVLLSALAVWELRSRGHSPGFPQHHGDRERPADSRPTLAAEPR